MRRMRVRPLRPSYVVVEWLSLITLSNACSVCAACPNRSNMSNRPRVLAVVFGSLVFLLSLDLGETPPCARALRCASFCSPSAARRSRSRSCLAASLPAFFLGCEPPAFFLDREPPALFLDC